MELAFYALTRLLLFLNLSIGKFAKSFPLLHFYFPLLSPTTISEPELQFLAVFLSTHYTL